MTATNFRGEDNDARYTISACRKFDLREEFDGMLLCASPVPRIATGFPNWCLSGSLTTRGVLNPFLFKCGAPETTSETTSGPDQFPGEDNDAKNRYLPAENRKEFDGTLFCAMSRPGIATRFPNWFLSG
ncbi:hypothetical protein CEXT_247531 [Caerostris extrusa]|uniref:Uncharacterized protein n=1 Tax=Caerostris extrusa TaxID=172846 RepID=A0AAV4XXP8_CAEEX|nr:hypothetical protein CEXT_247531 [Caerostris extrusa]